jgi:hypothetical protein
MKRNRIHLLLAAAVAIISMGAVAGAVAGLADIKTVYLLPMSNGLDQYLAVELTTGSVLKVVTDPLQADAIFTDHLGESLEQRLADLYGEKAHSDTPDDKADSSKTFARTGMQGQRGRGTIFLVDRKSRAVVWSDYQQPKYPTPDGMKHVAAQIAGKLARAIKAK